jgi:hypothetical protein
MLLSFGGRLGRTEEDAAKPPDDISKMLLEHGENGIIIDAIIAWITMNRDMTAENILKQLMEKSLDKDEKLSRLLEDLSLGSLSRDSKEVGGR